MTSMVGACSAVARSRRITAEQAACGRSAASAASTRSRAARPGRIPRDKACDGSRGLVILLVRGGSPPFDRSGETQDHGMVAARRAHDSGTMSYEPALPTIVRRPERIADET